MEIRRVTDVDDELVAAFARLIPQLSQAVPPNREQLVAIARDATLIVAIESPGFAGARSDAQRRGESIDRTIVGALTLTLYRIPTGLQGRIDDVVVDRAARGRGIGEAL